MSVEQSSDWRNTRMGSRPAAESARLVESLELEVAGETLDLPSFPEVAIRVRKVLAAEDVDVGEVVRIIGAEPALATRLMQLANSAALNPSGRRMTDLRACVTRMGFNMARSVTIAFAMAQLRRAEAYRGIEKPLTELWRESAQLAATSLVVARRFTRLNPDTAMTAGLLRNIGRLYLLTRAARFPQVLGDAATYQRIVADWQARITKAILRSWEAADEIVQAVSLAEGPLREHEGDIDLADVLIVSAAVAELGPDPSPQQLLVLATPAARRMQLDATACGAALADAHAEIEAIREALDL